MQNFHNQGGRMLKVMKSVVEFLIQIFWMEKTAAQAVYSLTLVLAVALGVGAFFYQNWWATPPFAFLFCINRLMAMMIRQHIEAEEFYNNCSGDWVTMYDP